MKKAMSILLTVAMLLLIVPLGAVTVAAATSGTTGQCTWTLENGVLTISGDGYMGNYQASSFNNSPKYAPWHYSSFSTVIITEGVTTIGQEAFYGCAGLRSVTIPNSVTGIGAYAFRDCTSLRSITIPDGVTYISGGAFYDCTGLRSITIPDSVTEISSRAFAGCNLEQMFLGDGIKRIGWWAFDNGSVKTVYYAGLPSQRKLIDFSDYRNDRLKYTQWEYHWGKHIYDNACDTDCNENECGSVREVPEHSYGAWSKADNSNHKRICSVCGNEETKAHTWDSGKVTKAATCKEAGVKTYTCTTAGCGATKTESIAKTTNHKWGAWSQTKAPTCTTKGTETRTCSVCSKKENRDIAATGHAWGEWATTTEATCEGKGVQTRTCAKCSAKETKDIAALGHKFSSPTVTKEATCTETGIESGKCSRCNKETTNTIKALGHKFYSPTVTKEATCTEKGVETGTCSVCGAEATRDIAAKGHAYGEAVVTKEATETETGLQTKTCAACGDVAEEEIPVLGSTPSVPTDSPENPGSDAPALDDTDSDTSAGDATDTDTNANKEPQNTSWILWIIIGCVVVIGVLVAVIVSKKKK